MSVAEKNTPFGVERNINEEYVKNNPIPYFFSVDELPLYFHVTLGKKNGTNFTYKDRVKIARWLIKKEYKNFISTDNMGVIFECMVSDRPEKVLIGNTPLVIEFTFRCNAPWAWSPYFVDTFDLSNNNTTKNIILENKSNIEEYVYPELWIQSLGDNNTIKLKNISCGGKEFIIENLEENEIIYINNKLKQIETNLPSIYRLKDFNRSWLSLGYGINNIKVTGKCLVKTRMRYGIAI